MVINYILEKIGLHLSKIEKLWAKAQKGIQKPL